MGQFIWVSFGFVFFGVFFGCGLSLVPYKYSVGGRSGLSQTVLSWPVGKGSQGCIYGRFLEQVAEDKNC